MLPLCAEHMGRRGEAKSRKSGDPTDGVTTDPFERKGEAACCLLSGTGMSMWSSYV